MKQETILEDESIELPNGQTQLLNDAREGNSDAAAQLLEQLYPQLRQLAARKMAREPQGHTLQATALVHEAYLQLVRYQSIEWKNSRHFFAAAAEAMRRLLIDRARRKARQRHGGDLRKAELETSLLTSEPCNDEILAVEEALCLLEKSHPSAADVVKLRFYAGLTHSEIAEIQEVSRRTVDNLWSFGRAWLYKSIKRS